MDVRRGDIIVVAFSGAYGKPRPALVIQDDAFNGLGSVAVLPITSDLSGASLLRIPLTADPPTGLRAMSHIMVDKIVSVPKQKVGQCIGRVDADLLQAVEAALSRFLGLALTP